VYSKSISQVQSFHLYIDVNKSNWLAAIAIFLSFLLLTNSSELPCNILQQQARSQPASNGIISAFDCVHKHRPAYFNSVCIPVAGISGRANLRLAVLLALDISAAFDPVDHTTLVECARTVFGINGATLDWLRSFVTESSQFIVVGTGRSETVACLSGVPQGSVFGLILLGMYVSPVGDLIA